MADSLKDLFSRRKFEQPDEFLHIKNFVKSRFGEDPKLKITKNTIIISVSNGAIAGALRMELHNLSEKLKTDKRLIIRIE